MGWLRGIFFEATCVFGIVGGDARASRGTRRGLGGSRDGTGGCGICGAAGVREFSVDGAGWTGRLEMAGDREIFRRCAIWISDFAEESGVCGDCDFDVGIGDWSEHSNF